MEAYDVFKDLAIIIIFAKFFGILARKCKAPQVVGEIVAGLLIGPSVLGLVDQTDFIVQMAEIGVILLMFSAGLETNLKDLMKTGFVAFLIACMGDADHPEVRGLISYARGKAVYLFHLYLEQSFISAIMVHSHGAAKAFTRQSLSVRS